MRFILSAFAGVILGGIVGLIIGWVFAPIEYTESSLADLDTRYRDDYTLMIALGYLDDGDVDAAIRRLSVLEVDNVPLYVQELTERFITNSRDVDDIRLLVTLAEGLGRLTPPMENFRQPRSVGGES